MARFASFAVIAAALGGMTSAPAAAQEPVALAGRRPHFVAAWAPAKSELDMSRAAVFRRRIPLELNKVSVADALEEISRRADLRISYSPTALPKRKIVSIHATEIGLAAALTDVLFETGLDVTVGRNGQLAVVVCQHEKLVTYREEPGAIAGRVTDGKTGEPLVGAEVFLEGTRWRTTSGDKGFYRLTGVDAGAYTITARRVGYAKQSRSLTVVNDQEVAADFVLQPIVTQLDELVTTVTGEQRLRELGHVIGRINADSVVREAPISSVSELLTARVPGLQVFTQSGAVGGKATLQIRSANSVNLGTEPIVIIDGVRYTTAATNRTGPFSVEETSRLNDINPNDIQSVEVVKGPSAATLYGTDAANGVVVITTKRGQAGEARWNGYARAAQSSIPKHRYEDIYWGWGTVFGTPNSTRSSCTLAFLVFGDCTQQDSVQRIPNPLNDPNYTLFHSEPSWQYGLNTSGGNHGLRYYFSGDYEDATGPFQMPRAMVEQIKLARGVKELPIEQLKPNVATRLNLRANVNAIVARNAELQFTTGYVNSATRTLGGPTGTSYASASRTTPGRPYGGTSPASVFTLMSTEHLDRFLGNVSGQWRPSGNIQARGTFGLDLANTGRYSLARPGESPIRLTGRASDDRTRQLSVTGDVGVSATVRRGRASFRTSAGAQYVRSLANTIQAQGTGLPPGSESPGQAATYSINQVYQESAALGAYVEETFGLNDRLFLTGALRMDGASNFGRDYTAATYPKVSASWILSEEPFMPRVAWLDELRLRYAFGASGRQAYSYMTLPGYIAGSAFVDGRSVNAITLYQLGNPNLKPERVREHEVGFDAGALGGRARVALTWFKRKTIDPVTSQTLSPGFASLYTNLGLITGHGFEAELTIRPVESNLLDWQLTVNHSVRRSVVVDLGALSESKAEEGGYVEGYSLGARFGQRIVGVTDLDGNGIVTNSEVQLSDMEYVGESTPPSSQTLTSTFALFNRRVRLSALFERRAGFTQFNHQDACEGSCRALVDINTPLEEQARALYAIANVNVEDGTFVRFRELSAGVDLPTRWAKPMRLRSAMMSFSMRNVALWSSFGGPDPESAAVNGFSVSGARNPPQGRSYVLRLDLGL